MMMSLCCFQTLQQHIHNTQSSVQYHLSCIYKAHYHDNTNTWKIVQQPPILWSRYT